MLATYNPTGDYARRSKASCARLPRRNKPGFLFRSIRSGAEQLNSEEQPCEDNYEYRNPEEHPLLIVYRAAFVFSDAFRQALKHGAPPSIDAGIIKEINANGLTPDQIYSCRLYPSPNGKTAKYTLSYKQRYPAVMFEVELRGVDNLRDPAYIC